METHSQIQFKYLSSKQTECVHLPCKAELVECPSGCLSLCVCVSVSKKGQQRRKAVVIASSLWCCCLHFSSYNSTAENKSCLAVYLTLGQPIKHTAWLLVWLLAYPFLTVYLSTGPACHQSSSSHLLVCPGCILVQLSACMLASLCVCWH